MQCQLIEKGVLVGFYIPMIYFNQHFNCSNILDLQIKTYSDVSLFENYFDQFLLITKTYFSHSRSEQFSKQNVYCCCKFDAKIFGNNNHQQKLGR